MEKRFDGKFFIKRLISKIINKIHINTDNALVFPMGFQNGNDIRKPNKKSIPKDNINMKITIESS